MRQTRYGFDCAGLEFGSGSDDDEFGSATWQVLMPFNIWTIGHVVQDCFCDDAAITTMAAKPRMKIKGHFDGVLFPIFHRTAVWFCLCDVHGFAGCQFTQGLIDVVNVLCAFGNFAYWGVVE
jgi:hypothetical protein